jgi:hypothetical protein
MRPLLLFLVFAISAGCTAEQQADFERGREWGREHVRPVVEALVGTAEQAVVDYGQGVAAYEETHPTVYQAPYYHSGLISYPNGQSAVYQSSPAGTYIFGKNGTTIITP